jgi:hypothetical protein
MNEYNFTLTDTFGGEANYSWVKKFTVTAKTDRAAIVAASKHFGLQGSLIRYYDGCWNIRGCNMRLFVD